MRVINFSLLRPEEIHAFSFRIIPIIEPVVEGNEFLSDIKPRLQQKTDNLAMALGLIRSSKFTTLLAEDDTGRDRIFIGFRNYVSAFTFHPDENLAQAAQIIETQIQASGTSLYNLGYAEETTQLNGLLAEMKMPAAQKAITAIGANFWLEFLIKAQQKFEARYQQKVAAEAGRDLPSTSPTKKDIVRYLSQVLSYLEANVEIHPEKYKPIVEKIDAVIVDVMTIARSRKSKASNTKDETPQP